MTSYGQGIGTRRSGLRWTRGRQLASAAHAVSVIPSDGLWKAKCKSHHGDSKMSWGSDLHRDFEKLGADAAQMADENARLRKINAQMLAALEYALPILQQGLPDTVNFDWTKDAIDKIQSAIGEAQSD